MQHGRLIIRAELRQLYRNRSFWWLMLLLAFLMTLAAWNTVRQLEKKEEQVAVQQALVKTNDERLIAQIDSLQRGEADYSKSYTLPTSGVRLTYNNHRVTHLPFSPLALLAMGQSDIYSNYKKVVLYFNDSYEMNSEELISPVEQLFGQLDLSFVLTYLLPLFIVLVSFNLLSLERETGRLPMIASQPLSITYWLVVKLLVRFLFIFGLLILTTLLLVLIFGVPSTVFSSQFLQLVLVLLLYCAFWFLMSLATNLAGFASGKSLILLTSAWVLIVFLIPSIVNQASKELYPVPSRLQVINHHQASYNAIEANLPAEMRALYQTHPDWASDDPVTKDLSNATGWNIDYLAKQYISQLKHQPMAEAYEQKIDERNHWLARVRLLSPAMVLQQALTSLAGTSTLHYRSFLRQSKEYAAAYRQQVFKGLFTNHAFTAKEIRELPVFEFDRSSVPNTLLGDVLVLLVYVVLLMVMTMLFSRKNLSIK